MGDFADVFKVVVAFFMQLCAVKCTFAGIEFSVGSIFIWSLLAGLILWFLGRMAR